MSLKQQVQLFYLAINLLLLYNKREQSDFLVVDFEEGLSSYLTGKKR